MIRKFFVKKKILTICLALVAIIGITVGLALLIKGKKADADGFVTIEVVDLDKTVVKSKKIGFKEGDTLIQIVKDNFDNVVITDAISPMIMEIETLVTADDWSKFISISVNDVEAETGISGIALKDGDKISFILTEFIYE